MGKLNHEWVKASLEMADNERSKLSERERELHGLSSIRLRCLINNLCAAEKCNYLEIGAYKGSTLIAAARGNDVKSCRRRQLLCMMIGKLISGLQKVIFGII